MHYLEQILLKANQRLLSMTGQRYELVRNEKKEEGLVVLRLRCLITILTNRVTLHHCPVVKRSKPHLHWR